IQIGGRHSESKILFFVSPALYFQVFRFEELYYSCCSCELTNATQRLRWH
ncbi:hypothetical protein MKW98_018116, partial [Papaver atlanticum]